MRMAEGPVRPMPSYSYPGLEVLEAVSHGLESQNRGRTCGEISKMLGIPKRRLRPRLPV